MSDSSKSRRRLGRGLDSLISLSEEPSALSSDNIEAPVSPESPLAGSSDKHSTPNQPSPPPIQSSDSAIESVATPYSTGTSAAVKSPDQTSPIPLNAASDTLSANPDTITAVSPADPSIPADSTIHTSATVIPLSVSSGTPVTPVTPSVPAAEPSESAAFSIRLEHVPLDQISVNPFQPRRAMNRQRMVELAASIKASGGLIQPIVVTPLPEGGYQLIAGERRLRASLLAEFHSIPCIIRPVDKARQAELALAENIHREDLNPIDRAIAYAQIMKQHDITQQTLAERMGEDRSTIANFLRLLDLTAPARNFVRDGQLSLGHAKLLAGVADALIQVQIAQKTVREGLSIRQLLKLINDQKLSSPKPATPAKPGWSVAHIAELEKNVSRQIGMRAQVRPGKAGQGKLVVHYASLDQFDQLLERMNIHIED